MCGEAGGKIKLRFISLIRLIPSSDDYAAPAAGDTATQRGTCCTRQTRRRLHGQPEDLVCAQVWHGGYNWAHVIKFVIGLCGFPGQGGGERGRVQVAARATQSSRCRLCPFATCHRFRSCHSAVPFSSRTYQSSRRCHRLTPLDVAEPPRRVVRPKAIMHRVCCSLTDRSL